MTIEQMKSFSEDKEFINKLIIQETDEDVKKLFKSRGVGLTDEDVEDLKNLTKMCVENKVELPEEILENVSGGVSVKKWLGKNWDKLAYVACATGVAVCIIYELNQIGDATKKTLKNIDSSVDNIATQTQQSINDVNVITKEAKNITNNIAHPIKNAGGIVKSFLSSVIPTDDPGAYI